MSAMRRYIELQLKLVEIRYQTWRNRRMVRKAYQTPTDKGRILRGLRLAAARGGLVLAGVLVVGGLWWAGRQALPRISAAVAAWRLSQPPAPRPVKPEPVHATAATAPQKTQPPATPAVAGPPAVTAAPDSGAWQAELSTAFCILANKAQSKMYLLRRSGSGWLTHKEYSIVTGRNDGPKVRRGDLRTPEGLYFIIGRKEASELSQIYGPLCYVLDYPNAEDLAAGRTGEGIWIHGTAPDSQPNFTHGCLGMRNDDMVELGKTLRIGIGTPVVIVDAPELSDPLAALDTTRIASRRQEVLAQYARRQGEFVQLLDNWRRAWQSADIEQYAQWYDSTRFSGQGMRWREWRERKSRIFQSGVAIDINLDSIMVADFSETTAVVRMLQNYQTNRLVSIGGKQLSFIKASDGWKIVSESTFPKEELSL